MDRLGAYIPIDRRHALARGQQLPDRTQGAALFADISGFTPLTEALANELGPRRGAEELTHQLNRVYTALVADVHLYHGSVIGFAGDAITCWFDKDSGMRAVSCALAMQSDMQRLGNITTPGGKPVELAIKTAVASGPVRRFFIGDPDIQSLDILAGDTLARMADAEHMAERGDVVITQNVMDAIGKRLYIKETRTDHGLTYAVVEDVAAPITLPPWPNLPRELSQEELRAWLLPPVYKHIQANPDGYLAELRPAATIFLYFDGIDYDADDEAGHKLDQYIRWVQNILNKYDGYLLQLIMGDKGSYLYAAFGAPISKGDDAAHAVAAALELRSPPPHLGYIHNTKIGISQGRMRTGAYGGEVRQTYGVLGDEVNTSARLMQKAAVEQVLVSPTIASSVAKRYHLNDLGSIPLKGKAEPLPVAEVTGLKEAQYDTSSFTERLIIGRESTLQEMQTTLGKMLSGHGQVLRMQGPAGIGKSHLAHAFHGQARNQGVRVISGACQSTTKSTPYYPWRQVFRSLLKVASAASDDEDFADYTRQQIRHVSDVIMGMNPEWEIRLPVLGDLLGLPIPENAATQAFDPRLRQESLFALAVDIVQYVSADRPVILFVDDAHWMDDASFDLTVALARAISGQRVLLSIMHRPPLSANQPILPQLSDIEHQYRIDLGELSAEAIIALTAVRLGGPIAPLAGEVIQTQAQGNPFFTEELVATMREAGQLIEVERGRRTQWELADRVFDSLQEANCMFKDDGEWHLKEEVTFSAADLGIPDSITGIVLARLDRLAEGEKLTVKVASVIGRLFEFDLLQHSHPNRPESPALMAQIAGIENHDFVHLETPTPDLVYMFKHSTMQEVAYDTLLFAQRRQLHSTIAEWYEANFDDGHDPENTQVDSTLTPFYPLLAYHYRYAENAEKERHYSILAGREASSQFANEDAIRYFTRALDLAPEESLEERYRILQSREAVYALTGAKENQLQDLQQLAKIAAELDDVQKVVGNKLSYTNYYQSISDFDTGVEYAQTAIDLAKKANLEVEMVEGYSNWGFCLVQQGQLKEAREQLNVALMLGDEYEYAANEPGIRRALGIIAFYEQNLTEAQNSFERALARDRATGNRKGEGVTLNNLAGINVRVGDLARSKNLSEEALQIDRVIGNRRGEARILSNLVSIYHNLGNYEEAVSAGERGLEIARQVADKALESLSAYNLSTVYIDQYDFVQAEAYATLANGIDKQIGDRISEGYSTNALGLALEGSATLTDAADAFQRAANIRREVGQPALMADLAGLARIALKQDRLDQAAEYADEIAIWIDENGLDRLEAPIRIVISVADVYAAQGDVEKSAAYVKQAYEFLQNKASVISDDQVRQDYLTKVPLHVELTQRMNL